jgi:hypothetical protein
MWAYLDAMHEDVGISCLIQGDARGADRLAKGWAESRGIPHEDYPADWRGHGRAAGPIRNRQMLDEARPEVVVAFPDHWPFNRNTGTGHMVTITESAGLPVRVVQPA